MYSGADRSGPLALPLTWNTSQLPQTVYLEGYQASTAARDVGFKALYTGPDGPCEDRLKLTVVGVDLDVDSDNDGTIDPDNSSNGTDDRIEEQIPGKFILVNNDDDNLDGSADLQDMGSTVGENDLVALQLNVQPAEEPGDGGQWRIAWSPGSRLRVWTMSDRSGDQLANGAWVPWATYSGIPSPLYAEALEPGDVMLTFSVGPTDQAWQCEDTVQLTAADIGFYRDEAGATVLDDWAEDPTSGNPRSPRYLLAKEDDVFIRVVTRVDLGDEFFSAKVTSDSDPTGINIKLNELSPAIHQNTLASGELLRLSTATASMGTVDTIAVVDEEVLRAELLDWVGQKSYLLARDVMVDRAEGTGGGINMFYAGSDRAVLQQRLWVDAKWWKNGDFDAADSSSTDLLQLRSLCKNAGDNAAHSLEADLLHLSVHGCEEGNLYTNATPNLLFDPDAVGPEGFSAGDWNDDLEWVINAACLTLNDHQTCADNQTCLALNPPTVIPTGRNAWQTSAFRGPRPIHGILGAFCTLSGDLQTQLQDFWNRTVNDNLTIVTSYALAMEFADANNPEPHAELWITGSNYTQDKIAEVQRDVDPSNIPGFSYITLASTGNPVCGRSGERADGAPSSPGDISSGVSRLSDLPPQVAYRLKLRPVIPDLKHVESQLIRERPDGALAFASQRFYSDATAAIAVKSSDAYQLGTAWVSANLPSWNDDLTLRGIYPVRYSEYTPDGEQKTAFVAGHIVDYVHLVDGVRVLDDVVRLRFIGKDVSAFLVKLTEVLEIAERTERERFVPVATARVNAVEAVRLDGASEPQVVVQELVYCNGLDSANLAQIPGEYEYLLTYRFLVRDGQCSNGCRGKSRWVFVDAQTAEVRHINPY